MWRLLLVSVQDSCHQEPLPVTEVAVVVAVAVVVVLETGVQRGTFGQEGVRAPRSAPI
jgi:hypothetical protein